MELMLTIAGGICLGFVFVVVAVVLLFKFWLKRQMTNLMEAVGEMTMGIAPFMQPPRIHVTPLEDVEWNDAEAIKKLTRPLRKAGFADAGTFTIEEYGDIKMQAFAHPEEQVYAVVYEHPDMGSWFDLVCRYADGTLLTYTSAKPTGLDQAPGRNTRRFEPGSNPGEAYQALLRERPAEGLQPTPADKLAPSIEQAYAEEMDWRFERGGLTEQEIRNNLATTGQTADDATVKQVHVMWQGQVSQWLEIKLKEAFRAKSNPPPDKWKRLEERIIVIHDRLDADTVVGHYSAAIDWDSDEAEREQRRAEKTVAKATPREAFASLIANLPPERAFKRLGHVSQPVPADVYLSPKLPDND
jgi:hypothetical protein